MLTKCIRRCRVHVDVRFLILHVCTHFSRVAFSPVTIMNLVVT